MDRSNDWMDQAEGDLEHAQNDLDGEFFDWACFSAQQAAEKAVKAVFQRMGAEAWGHSVVDLLVELKNRREVPEELVEFAMELDRVYISGRYPNAHPSGSPRKRYHRKESERMVGYAKRIIEFCSGVLSEMDQERVD